MSIYEERVLFKFKRNRVGSRQIEFSNRVKVQQSRS